MRSRLKLTWDKMVKKNDDALKREIDRTDVEQFKDPLNLSVKKFVAKLPKQDDDKDCACSCGIMVCPCTCEPLEATVVVGDIPRISEADSIDKCVSSETSPC